MVITFRKILIFFKLISCIYAAWIIIWISSKINFSIPIVIEAITTYRNVRLIGFIIIVFIFTANIMEIYKAISVIIEVIIALWFVFWIVSFIIIIWIIRFITISRIAISMTARIILVNHSIAIIV